MNNKLLTFELESTAETLDIHLDEQGLNDLLFILMNLKKSKTNDHDHLITPSWGGNELTEDKQDERSRLLNKVTIHFWKK